MSTRFQLTYKTYSRRFQNPVRFGKSLAELREGIVVRLVADSGAVGFGEIAPIESFGSESLRKAQRLLESYCGVIREEAIRTMPSSDYPCTVYALQSAHRRIVDPVESDSSRRVKTARLMPIGAEIKSPPESSRVWKFKIGTPELTIGEEQERLKPWLELSRERESLIRLDANEQLDRDTTLEWIDFLSDYRERIEFLEQPTDRTEWFELESIVNRGIPIALDESVELMRGQSLDLPSGLVYVLKPSLGDLQLIEDQRIPPKDIVISSVFESAFGFSQLLDLPFQYRVPGLDTQRYFEPDVFGYPQEVESHFHPGRVAFDSLWQHWK